MARIRIRSGQSEIELDSRDLHIDNETMGNVITEISRYLQPSMRVLDELPEAEVAEPEFEPVGKLAPRLESLEGSGFFASPRTVSETVEQLRESGALASPLDVSRGLAKMALSRRLSKNPQGYVACG